MHVLAHMDHLFVGYILHIFAGGAVWVAYILLHYILHTLIPRSTLEVALPSNYYHLIRSLMLHILSH